jgi:hypothetical protein
MMYRTAHEVDELIQCGAGECGNRREVLENALREGRGCQGAEATVRIESIVMLVTSILQNRLHAARGLLRDKQSERQNSKKRGIQAVYCTSTSPTCTSRGLQANN